MNIQDFANAIQANRRHVLLAVFALLIGLLVGLISVAFFKVLILAQTLFWGDGTEQFATYVSNLAPWWLVLLIPTLGGLAVGLLTSFFTPQKRPLGIADVIEGSALHSGYISLKQAWRAALLSILSIGSGASVGREGPIVHLSAAVGSMLARQLALGRAEVRMLLGCGVAAAIAGSFNAPLAGMFFALEVVIGHYGFASLAPIMISSAAAAGVRQLLIGSDPTFSSMQLTIQHFSEGPAFILLGVLSGVTALVLIRSVFLARSGFDRVGLPLWIRPAIAGLIVGLIALYFPAVLGVGHEGIKNALLGSLPFGLALGLLFAKIAATGLCLGGGFSGGIFSPALLIGATLGLCLGTVTSLLAPDFASSLSVYAVLGMAAVSSAVLGSPISTILMMFELTGQYSLMLGVMASVVSAMFVMRFASVTSFFAEQLRVRGIFVKDGRDIGVLKSTLVAKILDEHVSTVPADASMSELKHAMLNSDWGRVCILDQDQRLLGIASLAQDRARLNEQGVLARDIAHDCPSLLPSQSLDEAWALMQSSHEAHIPVVENRLQNRLLGLVHEQDLSAAYHESMKFELDD